jgi:hypothetical protein
MYVRLLPYSLSARTDLLTGAMYSRPGEYRHAPGRGPPKNI